VGGLLIKPHAFNTMPFLRLMDLENFNRNFDSFLGFSMSKFQHTVLAPIKYRSCPYCRYADSIAIFLGTSNFYPTLKGYLLSIQYCIIYLPAFKKLKILNYFFVFNPVGRGRS
jgi:hypothetical protein